MLAVSLVASEPTKDLRHSFGKPYNYTFWSIGNNMKLVADKPFSRGDLVDVEETSDETIYYLNHVDAPKISDEARQRLGLLVPLTPDIPLSLDTKWSFSTEKGTVDILRSIRCESQRDCSFLLLVIARTSHATIIGRDEVYGTEISWTLEYEREFARFIHPLKQNRVAVHPVTEQTGVQL